MRERFFLPRVKNVSLRLSVQICPAKICLSQLQHITAHSLFKANCYTAPNFNSNAIFFSLFSALIIGASVGGIYLYFSLKRWFTKRDFYNKLSLIVRNYSDKANESQSKLSYKWGTQFFYICSPHDICLSSWENSVAKFLIRLHNKLS